VDRKNKAQLQKLRLKEVSGTIVVNTKAFTERCKVGHVESRLVHSGGRIPNSKLENGSVI
jgi:hypothetical protein